MKIEKNISPEACRMIRRFVEERARRVKLIEKKLAALKARFEKASATRQQALDDEQEGFRFVLEPHGFKNEYGPSLNVNMQTGVVTWDDGQSDPKILEESGKALAQGKKKRIGGENGAEILPLEPAGKE